MPCRFYYSTIYLLHLNSKYWCVHCYQLDERHITVQVCATMCMTYILECCSCLTYYHSKIMHAWSPSVQSNCSLHSTDSLLLLMHSLEITQIQLISNNSSSTVRRCLHCHTEVKHDNTAPSCTQHKALQLADQEPPSSEKFHNAGLNAEKCCC
jgi:hypothetical protein